MTDYSKQELEEALKSNISTINKCKKALPKLKEKSAQQTLLSRRIKALQISIELIEKELLGLLNQ
jgi:F0F1-type ATP synthase assembly protein I